MRLIDADALEYDTEWSEYHDGFTAYSQMEIDTAPSIDIVRCKECKYKQQCRKAVEHTTHEITSVTIAYRPIDFCSYGQKGDENVETD